MNSKISILMMKKYIKILPVLALLFLSAGKVMGQSSSLYFLQNIPESNDLNPALVPNARWYIGVPGINSITTGFHTDLTYSNFLTPSDLGVVNVPVNSPELFNKFMNNLESTSVIGIDHSISILRFGFQTKRGYVHFSNSIKMSGSYKLPKSMFNFLDGMGEGELNDLSSLGVNAMAYHEVALGYSHNVLYNLSVGAKLKYLGGIFGAQTDIKQASVYSSVDVWKVKLDGTLNVSGPVEFIPDANGEVDDVQDIDMENKAIKDALYGFKNPGLAIDLGAEYTLNEQWNFSASLVDFGRIWWNTNLSNVTYITDQEITAIDTKVKDWEDFGTVAENFGDSLIENLSSTITNNKFSTNLVPKLYVAASYDLTPNLGFGVLSSTRFYKGRTNEELMVSANLNAYKVVSTSLNYSLNFDGQKTVGLALGLSAGAFQFYLATDYLYTTYEKIKTDGNEYPVPKDFKDFRFQFGVNLLFGRRKASGAAQLATKYNRHIPGEITY